MFFKIGVPGVLGLTCKFIKNRLQHRCFAIKFANFFKKNFFYRTPPVAASKVISTFWSCINTCFVFIIHISMSLKCAGNKKHWNEIQFITETGVRKSLQVLVKVQVNAYPNSGTLDPKV